MLINTSSTIKQHRRRRTASISALLVLIVALFVGVLCASSSSVHAQQKNKSNNGNGIIVDMDQSSFDRTVGGSKGLWIVAFVAPWCGHCQRLEPELEKAAKSLGGVVNVGRVNADQERGLASRFGVQGFPTIKVFQGGNTKSPEEYNGGRTAKSIVDYMMYKFNGMRDPVKVLASGDQLGQFVTRDPQVPKAILFTQKDATPALFKSLAIEFDNDKMQFAVVTKADSDSKKSALEALNVSDARTLVVLPPADGSSADVLSSRKVYSGKLVKSEMLSFLKQNVVAVNNKKAQQQKSSPTNADANTAGNKSGEEERKARPSSSAGAAKSNAPVQIKTQQQLEEVCKRMCIVSAFNAERDSDKKSLFDELARKHPERSIIEFAYIDEADLDHDAWNAVFESVERGSGGLLDVVVLRGQRKKMLVRGGLDSVNAPEFVDRLLDGFAGLTQRPMDKIPALVKATARDEL